LNNLMFFFKFPFNPAILQNSNFFLAPSPAVSGCYCHVFSCPVTQQNFLEPGKNKNKKNKSDKIPIWSLRV
jgi:hypothetical protein